MLRRLPISRRRFLLVALACWLPGFATAPAQDIRSASVEGGQFAIEFGDAEGMAHGLQAATDPAAGEWGPVAGFSYERTGPGSFRYVVPTAGFDRRFFRVTATPPVTTIVDGGTYQFVNVGSGLVLEVDAREARQGVDEESDAQQWTLTELGGNLYNLLVEYNGEALDHYAGVGDGNNIGTWSYGGVSKVNQQFRIEAVESGIFRISSAAGTLDHAIGPDGLSDADEANVVQAPYTGDPHQHWRVHLPGEAVPKAHTIHLLGDSTVANYGSGNYPQTGWGQVLHRFLDTQVDVRNRAVGGTSSRSFHTQFWSGIRDELEPGDFVFIGFGINDAAADAERHTEPFGSFQDYLTIYVNETLAAGAHPVIVSTVRRNAWNGTDPDTLYSAYHDYPVASRQLAAQLGVPLIDLDQLTVPLLEPLGPAYVGPYMYMVLDAGNYPNFPGGAVDNVHFQEMGAIEMARLVVDGIQLLAADPEVGALVPYLRPVHAVGVSSNLPDAGLVTRDASYPQGTPVTLQARPHPGYRFLRWEHPAGNTVSTNRILKFAMGSSSREYLAVFGEN